MAYLFLSKITVLSDVPFLFFSSVLICGNTIALSCRSCSIFFRCMMTSNTTVESGNTDLVYTSFIDGKTLLSTRSKIESTGSNNLPVSKLIPVVSPATNQPVFYFEESSPQQVEDAVSAAQRAFDNQRNDGSSWSHPSRASFRAKILTRIASSLSQHVERLADLEVQQIGRSRKEIRLQLSCLPDWFEYFASLIRVHEDTTPPFGPGYVNTVRRIPLGVVAQITPFNHLLLSTIKNLAPALAAGNTVVIKPGNMSPASIIELANILTDAGLPPGVVNVVLGDTEVSSNLIQDTRIQKVDFTGRPAAVRSIGRTATENLYTLTQELDGKGPMIVFDQSSKKHHAASTFCDDKELDDYLDPIVNGCAFGAFIAPGQTCITGTRILVEYTIYDEFKMKLLAKTKMFKIGDPNCMDTTIGPVISTKQLYFIDSTIRDAISSDGPMISVVCGGKQYRGFSGKEEEHLNNGNFYEPTIVAVCSQIAKRMDKESDDVDDPRFIRRRLTLLHHQNVVFQKELFGPVVALIPFQDEEHAIELANDTKFSVGCSIWTRDLVQAHQVADGVKAGIIWINDPHMNHPSSAWAGSTKESGIGRENGLDAYREYTQIKNIMTNCNELTSDWFKDPNARYN